MPLQFATFSNKTGGATLFKALGHPESVAPVAALLDRLRQSGPVAVYDPVGHLAALAELYDLSDLPIAGMFVQDVEQVGSDRLGQTARPVTDLPEVDAGVVFLAAFDAGRLAAQLRSILQDDREIVTLDDARIPESLHTDRRRYLSPLNFATNFAFFRDEDGHHTRLVTANYWGGYGAKDPRLWLTLFDAAGRRLASWEESLPGPNGTVTVDSAEVRARFDLPAFAGQLFVHVVGAAGHDVVKYALDTYGDEPSVLSCTHDANAWPADYYAGLPAPDSGETVLLWVQNSHPCPIPPGGIGLARMGDDAAVPVSEPVPAFGSAAVDVAAVLPGLHWPDQVEVHAGRHFVRPRYEIRQGNTRQRIAHANVERTDLRPDPGLVQLEPLLGKGHVLPAPLLPPDRYVTELLPTPMARSQAHLPIAAVVYDGGGAERARHRFGVLRRTDSVVLDVTGLLAEAGQPLDGGYGHVELVYDFDPETAGGLEADGWLHAIFRYRDRQSGHAAETSFGSHMFNSLLVYKDEPQSYAGPPPGLSTRLFLRCGHGDTWDTFCHLIYAASGPWLPHSDTKLILTDRNGREVATKPVAIPCGGSYRFRVSEAFDAEARQAAGPDSYVLIRDTTCRLFGYHGLMRGDDSFSLDHMFGF